MNSRIFMTALLLVASSHASAQKVYRCMVDGTAKFQQTPCADSKPGENVIDARQRTSGLGGVNNPDLVRQSELRTLVERGRVTNGMTPDQVKRAWGEPTKVNASSGGREQWVFRRSSSETQYVYFIDGLVSGWN